MGLCWCSFLPSDDFFVCRGNTRLLLVGFRTLPSIREPFLHAPAPYSDENKIRCVHIFPIISFFNSHLPSLWPIRKLCVLILFFVFFRIFIWEAHNSLENAIQHVSTWKRSQAGKKKMTASYRKTSFVMRSRLRGFFGIRWLFKQSDGLLALSAGYHVACY